LQVFAAAGLREGSREKRFLPIGLGSLELHAGLSPDSEIWSHARLRPGAEPGGVLTFDVQLLDEQGRVLLEAKSLSAQQVDRGASRAEADLDMMYTLDWRLAPRPEAPDPRRTELTGSFLIIADRRGIGEALASRLSARGARCVVVRTAEADRGRGAARVEIEPGRLVGLEELIKTAFPSHEPPCRGVVHLGSLDAAPSEETDLASLAAAHRLGSLSALGLVQALAQIGYRHPPRLWLVTRGVQTVAEGDGPAEIAQSPLWGLGRVIAQEHPELRCACVDLPKDVAPEGAEALFAELLLDSEEPHVVLRGSARYIARLVRNPKGVGQRAAEPIARGDHPFRLAIATPGILDGIVLQAMPRRSPGPGEVEIAVQAAGLNFLDVLIAMGVYPDTLPDGPLRLGGECTGTITAIGDGVIGLSVGQEVVAFASGSFASHVTTRAELVAPRPAHLLSEEAATLPIALVTAHYALEHLGRLRAGERVLIHAASGGLGIAAIQIAEQAGAEIFATAGSPEKRDFLRSLGIRHVMDSRTLDFADEIMDVTAGLGVDVVLSSLTGRSVAKGLSILRPFGRFLDVSKRDIHENNRLGLAPFMKNISYASINLSLMMNERPDLLGSLLREVMKRVEQGALRPIPFQTFPISRAVEAFHSMAQAKHTGKLVIALSDAEARIEAPASRAVRPHATYLVTGGLGGLGLVISAWLCEQGATHLVLVGRSEPSAAARASIDAMRVRGAEVVVERADVADTRQIAEVLAKIEASMPVLRGIVHCAAVLDDGILLQSNEQRFRQVLAPKIDGAYNLHTLCADLPLDFFVLFSSAAALLGSPGQGSYVAANEFLDALAHHRRARGLPALSIDWGPWAEVGLASARADRGGRIALRGLSSLTPEEGTRVFERLLAGAPPQVCVMRWNLAHWRQFYPKAAASPLFAALARELEPVALNIGAGSVRKALEALGSGEQRRAALESYLAAQVALVLRLPVEQVDTRTPLRTLGFDSLMAIELRNRIEGSLALTLSATVVWNHPTIEALSTYLADKMGLPLVKDAPAEAALPAAEAAEPEALEMAKGLLEELDDLSADDLAELLNLRQGH
jgi:NADPH:quinone reductase-like Zn-dependent oxidoreductase/acyl carrier protein